MKSKPDTVFQILYHQILVRNRKHLFSLIYSKVRRPNHWYLPPSPLTFKYSKYAHSINWDSSIAFQPNALENLIVFGSYFFFSELSTQLNVVKLSLLSGIRVNNIKTSWTWKVVSLTEMLPCNILGQKKHVLYVDRWKRCLKQSFFLIEKGVVLIVLLHGRHSLCDVVAKKLLEHTDIISTFCKRLTKFFSWHETSFQFVGQCWTMFVQVDKHVEIPFM